MLTLKKGLKENNIKSDKFKEITTNYTREDLVKIGLYILENDCLEQDRIELIKGWLHGKTQVREIYKACPKTRNQCIFHILRAILVPYPVYAIISAIFNSIDDLPIKQQKNKIKEYNECARLHAYEDLDFPYRKEARTFDLDNSTDLNVFLDFLTDNYPAAITYPREEYFKSNLAKEYLKVIYQ